MRPLLALGATALCLSGCGGVGGLIPFSIYEGSWVGTWDGAVDDGPATLNIDATGDITGVMHSDGTNEDGTVSGSILNNGTVTMSVTFPGDPAVPGAGTLVLTSAGSKVQGTVDFTVGSGTDSVVFDLDGP